MPITGRVPDYHAMEMEFERRETTGCELVAEVVSSFGEVRLKVTGASMIPVLWPGDVITVRHETAELQPGQIVLYRREGKLVAHRIVRNENGLVVTRGEALPQDDRPVQGVDIVGRVVGVVRNGRSADFEQSQWSRAFSSMLRRSDFCLRMALRWHNRLRRIVWAS